MNAELVKPGQQAIAVQPTEAESFLKMIADAARDPSVQIEKMERLMAMKERFDARQADIAFSQAMARLQPTLPRITKHGRVEVRGTIQSSYAKLEDIDEVIRPLYSAEGFSISWNTQSSERGAKITGILRHVGGHSEPYEITLPLDTSGNKNSVQGVGSTFSYGKRYLLAGMFNLITVGVDDDGNGGGTEAISQEQAYQILDKVRDSKANEAKFLEYMGVSKVEEIMVRDYRKAMAALEAKARKS